MREDQGDGRRQQNVPGQHRFIDAAQERISIAALQLLVGDGRVNHVRNYVGENSRCRGVDDIDVKEHVGQGSQQEDDARQAVQEVNHRVHETQALRQREAFFQQGIVKTEDLDHAACPTDALTDMSRKRFG